MPPSPDVVPDDLILAAVARAELHRGRPDCPPWVLYQHLDIRPRSAEARQVRARRDALITAGSLEQRHRHSVELAHLTAKGRARLRRAKNLPALPESPQHREWRQARTLAAQEIERMREILRTTLTEAIEQLDADASSDTWFELSARLKRDSWLVGSATHCLHEWVEPTDERADTDERNDPSDAGLSRAQKKRRKARRLGRRNTSLWGDED